MNSLGIREIADNCIHHGAHIKHLLGLAPKDTEKVKKGYLREEGKEFANPKLGKPQKVNSFEQYKKHIEKTLRNPETLAMKGANGRVLYYNKKTNTFISQNNRKPKASTCYRIADNKGKPYEAFKREVQKECEKLGIDTKQWKKQLQKGGYNKVHTKQQKLEAERKVKLEKERRRTLKNEYKKEQKKVEQKKDIQKKQVHEQSKTDPKIKARLDNEKRLAEYKKRMQEKKKQEDDKRKKQQELNKEIEENLRRARERREQEKLRQKELELKKELQKKL
jgi:hypothetical protein